MCGINGILYNTTEDDLQTRIKYMNDAIMHRGPDAEGVMLSGNLAFGHRRLAIIDLDRRSNQPMQDLEHSCMLTYNGEIYNYQNLKRHLGYRFITESDTEVLLAGLREMGMEFIKGCNGMFAFAFWDKKEQELYLCRDRMGIKPLYYYCDDKMIVFSSEIKGILKSGLVKAELNYDAIDDYMGYRYVREPYTLFRNIFQVEAGTYCKFNDKFEKEIIRYWDIPCKFNMESQYDKLAIREEFETEFVNSVKRRLISDVPVGTYLSGGIDSSLLSAVATKQKMEQINTYTIGFDECNEFEYARIVADKYHTIHHEIVMDEQEYIKKIEEVIGYKDAPLGVPNEIPLAIMSKKLKENITVVLSGEGADELLGGYGRIFRSPFDYENNQENVSYYDYFINKYEYVPRKIRDKYLACSHDMREQFDKKIGAAFSERENEYNVFYFFHKYHVKGLLQRVDTTTMMEAVEARVPFLDHNLVEYSYEHIPYEMKLAWKQKENMVRAKKMTASQYSESLDIPKAILRDVAYKYLPREVVDRKKVGFPVPLSKWSAHLCEWAAEILPGACWLKKELVSDLLADCMQSAQGAQIVWMFINMQIFYKMYFEKEWRY